LDLNLTAARPILATRVSVRAVVALIVTPMSVIRTTPTVALPYTPRWLVRLVTAGIIPGRLD